MNAILQIAAVLLVAATPAHDYTGFQTVQVAPGIYTYVGPECTPAGLVTGNVTAIIGEEAVLVVDSGHFPSSARKMIAHLKNVTSKPVKFLVNTHWHQDHVMGNIAFQREWPEVEILAHPFTVKELEKPENGKAYAENLQKQLPGAMEQLRGILLSGKLPNGNALNDTQRETFEEMVAAFTVSIREAPVMEFVPATRRVERDTEISLGKRKVANPLPRRRQHRRRSGRLRCRCQGAAYGGHGGVPHAVRARCAARGLGENHGQAPGN